MTHRPAMPNAPTPLRVPPRVALSVAALGLALVTACQGRPEPDWTLLSEEPGEEPAPDVDEECALADCFGPRRGTPDVMRPNEPAPAPAGKDADEIRSGLIGAQPGVAAPSAPAEDLVEATCEGPLYAQIEADEPGNELHVISVHEALGEERVIRVRVERKEAVALVLSSWGPARWVVDQAQGARITEIVLNGYHDQSVEALAHIPVTELEGEQSLGAFGIGGGDDKGRTATAGLIRGAEEATGLPLHSFHGCEAGSAFTLTGD